MANFSILNRSSNGVFYYAQDSMTVWDNLVIMEMQQAGAGSYFTIQMADVPNFPQLFFRFYGNFSFITQQNTEGQFIPYIEQGSIVNRIDVIDQTGKIYSQVTGVALRLTMNKTTRQLEPNDFIATAIRPIEVISPANLFQFADSLVGSAGIETLNGYAGNDTIDGGAGADSLIGGNGTDVFRIRAGDAPAGESIDGGDGIDAIEAVGVAATQNLLQQGRITLSGLSFNSIEELRTNGTEVELPTFFFVGNGGMQTVRGKIGSTDVVTFTNASNANFESLGFADWTNGEDLVGIVGTSAAESIFGTGFDDVIVGGLGADSLRGNGGNDRFIVLAGEGGLADSIDGGIGNDTLQADGGTGTMDLRLSTLTSIETLNVVTGTIEISAREINGGVIAGSPTLISGKIGTITGSSAPDLIRSATVDVYLDSGMQGADFTNLTFTNWNDFGVGDGWFRVFGVAQTQVVLGMANEENWIVLNLAAQSTFIRGGSQFDYLVGGNFADWIDAGDSYDYVIALGGNDIVDLGGGGDYALAGAGDDAVSGLAGNDTILGEAGVDTLNGGAGADSIDGGADFDWYFFHTEGGASAISIDLTNGVFVDSFGTTDSAIVNMEGFTGTNNLQPGGTLSDVMVGNAVTNVFFGFGGRDHLFGAGGNDYLDTGAGVVGQFDTADGGTGNDTLVGGPNADFLYGGDGTDSLVGNDSDDWLVGGDFSSSGFNGEDSAWGGAGADVLAVGSAGGRFSLADGGAGNDTLYGSSGVAGNDVLRGGAGSDYIWMGSGGADVFRFETGDLLSGDVDTVIVSFSGTWQFSFATSFQNMIAVSAGTNAGMSGVYLAHTGSTWACWVPFVTVEQIQSTFVFA
ncbi:MAG: hypothetical protein ACRCWF_18155 [Beijerinckiaceae bacterium]